ncbi:hypothetical protein [Mesomycoplasma molare]|uniref:Uncharacterized protein n=1 Tax=Mesomycoplasma molare TaxID=171288 RepID=A0ABY5TTZ0_9BACT|nr:hypothetical protein [Mesomycoplasma molare]UWD34050.1 hypothetical protein NX772_03005 [Mesomycoplasma molare]
MARSREEIINATNKHPNTLPWVESFFYYITAPTKEKNKYSSIHAWPYSRWYEGRIERYHPKENYQEAKFKKINTPLFIEALKHSEIDIQGKNARILDIERNLENNLEIKGRYFNNDSIITFYTINLQTESANGRTREERFSFIELISNPFSDNPKFNYAFDESIENKGQSKNYSLEILKVKRLRTGYYFLMVKQNWTSGKDRGKSKNYFIKLNDIRPTENGQLDRIIFQFKQEIEQWNWLNKINKIDFNESYSDENLIDIIISTTDNLLWYGQLNSALVGQSQGEWKNTGYIRLNKWSGSIDAETGAITSSTNPTIFSGINNLTITTLSKTINKKKHFFGNIVVATNETSSINQSENETQKFETVIETGGKNNYNLKQAFETAFSTIKQPNSNINFISGNTKIKIKTKNHHTLKYQTGSGAGINTLGYLATYKRPAEQEQFIEINLDFERTKRLILENPNLLHENSFRVVYEDNRIKVYIADEIIKHEIANFKLAELNAREETKTGEEFEVTTEYIEVASNIAYTQLTKQGQSEVYKIVIRDFEETPNKIIFEKDKVIQNIQDTKEALVLENNEVYLPVKQRGQWKIYLFDNKTQLSEDNLIIPTPAKETGTLGYGVEKITLLGIKETETSKASLIALINQNKAIIFSYNTHHNQPLEFWSYLENDCFFDHSYASGHKEQNIFKLLFFKQEGNQSTFNFLNIKYDGKPFNSNNQPFLYKRYQDINLINQSFNISSAQSNNLFWNGRTRDINVLDNKITFSSHIKSNALNINQDNKKINEIQWMDNNGNIAFRYQDNFIKGKNENIQLNYHLNVSWQDDKDKKDNDHLAREFAKLFIDQSNIDIFRRSHIKFTFEDENGTIKTKILNVTHDHIRIIENSLYIPIYLILKEAPYWKKYHSFYYGDNDLNIWTEIPDWEPLILEANQESRIWELILPLEIEIQGER